MKPIQNEISNLFKVGNLISAYHINGQILELYSCIRIIDLEACPNPSEVCIKTCLGMRTRIIGNLLDPVTREIIDTYANLCPGYLNAGWEWRPYEEFRTRD